MPHRPSARTGIRRRVRQASALALLPLALLLIFTAPLCASCGKKARQDALSRLTASDAAFTVCFPSCAADLPDVICSGEKTGSVVTLTVRSPERSAGVSVRADCSPHAARVVILPSPAGDEEIPVTEEAAAFLLSVFRGLCGAQEPLETKGVFALPAVKKTPDGRGTEIAFSSAVLTLGESGMPESVRAADLGGGTRVVLFEDYRLRS